MVVDLVKVQISLLTPKHETELLKAYEKIYSSREEVKTFYERFIQNGWISGAWKNRELIGVLTWAPRQAVKNGLAEIVDFWSELSNEGRELDESLWATLSSKCNDTTNVSALN